MLFVVRDVMRTAHMLAAGVWVGGSVVYWLVITPAMRRHAEASGPHLSALMGELFRSLVSIAIGVLVISGVFLVFDRLTGAPPGIVYISVLIAKVAVSLGMFGLAIYQAQEARRLARQRGPLWRIAPRVILALGCVAFLLGSSLTLLYETQLGLVR